MVLNDVCEVYSGYALKSFNEGKEGFPVIKIGNILTDGRLSLEDCQYTTETVNTKYYSQKDDVYVALSGATTGKIGLMETDESYVINQRVGVVRRKDKKIPSRFIKYFLLKQTERILQEAAGCAQPNISPKQIGAYTFPSFSSEKMEEITRELDKVTNVIQYRYKQNNLLDCLIKARFVEMFGDLLVNSKGYPIKKLPEISEYWNGLTYKPDEVADNGTIVLRSSNIQNGELDFDDIVRVKCSIGERKFVKNNDILMCSRNGSARLVGKVALINNICEPMSFGAFMMIIRSEYYSYLMTFFQMDAFRTQITTGATTTINQITGKMLDDVKLPVPDLIEIEPFTRFVQQINKSKFSVMKGNALFM